MKRIAILSTIVLLTGCMFGADTEPEDQPLPTPDDMVDDIDDIDTETDIQENVFYTGVVQPAGISIYQEGTHRLTLDDGEFILLESDLVDLNGYVGEEVEVTGDLRNTVEAGGQIMTVTSIELVDLAADDDTDDDEQPEELGTDTEEDEPAQEPEEPSEPQQEPEQPSEPEQPTEEPEQTAEEPADSGTSADTEADAQVKAMTAMDYSSSNWTQQYCTEHIGFCIPIHRNWWYRSFGYTTSHLWYTEVGPTEIDSIGDGAISIRLVDGSISQAGATDGAVIAQGNTVTGYRSWSDNRHFEIVANAQLQDAVAYLTANLTTYEPEEEPAE